MLKIRLSRTGKNTQPTFRLVVQEHTAPIKGKFVEEIGYYRPTTPEKPFNINSERVKYWISVGARPSDTVATLLKKQGFEGMEQYMEPRDKKRKKKGQDEGEAAQATSTTEPKKVKAKTPKQEKLEAKKEVPAAAPEDAQPETAAASEVPAEAPETSKEVPAEAAPAPTEESPKS